ncbi:acyl-CoA dehydrogenase family protein [Deinococcus maricopensis]|uniref:glutaryl-CoA dehydrogenase (ETF) n=1 Tax=Deinococcus maricopensis (strain DSM 21211 / LMG 22137 / NRRL B-23946 / LB-34) TaxID=709986 RepID=E8UC44_DEIML|nr:acyl-CoA dehydrogenase family protein [Deinococcus maricopensis]ADV68705.1 Glutaryl-CoA dehydrogenase [Deinococcus maricopensis DSM 21211]
MLDYLHALDLLAPEDRAARASVRAFADAELLPHIGGWWDAGHAPTRDLMQRFGALGLLGPKTPEAYGGAGASSAAYGVMMYELERADSGLRSMASVQGSLVMYPILAYGSDAQRRRYLPELAAGRLIGCFGLTEADGGSDPGAMRTRARRDGQHYVLNGTKMWITNSPLADVALVWAKDDDGHVRGFLVDRDTPGLHTPTIERKMSLRASTTGEVVLDDVRVPAEQMLPDARGLKGPLSCLTQARYGIAWGALGALEAVYAATLAYTTERTTFGRPLAARQLVQDKLVGMLTAHTTGLLLAARLGQLADAGALTPAQVSLGKRTNVRAALNAARAARELHGGNGITTEYPVIRHMLNLETVDTYEGTHDVHTLIVGRDLTGLNALE